jgi:hypothetical protein
MYVFRALSTSFASMLQTGCARPGWNEVQAGLVARLLPASLAPLHAHPAGLVAVWTIKAERGASESEGGAPWERLIYEGPKLVCMNARKMNVAIELVDHRRVDVL